MNSVLPETSRDRGELVFANNTPPFPTFSISMSPDPTSTWFSISKLPASKHGDKAGPHSYITSIKSALLSLSKPLSLLLLLPAPPPHQLHEKKREQQKPAPKMSLLLTSLSLLLSLPFIPSSLQSMVMDPSERETLFKVMESMSSDRDWRSSNPEPCKPGSSWPGLECKRLEDNHLHVTRLDFGSSPNPGCKKTAAFPAQIFNLPHLQSLFFFNCFRFTKTTLSAPSKPSSALQQLSLKSNPALVGPIPPQISLLASLQVLTLSQNRLYGKIPESISLLASLVHLDLSYNSLAGQIPAKLSELKSLAGLDLSYNSLSGPIPQSIGKMGLLQKLDLSSNSLTGAIPESLGNLSLLNFLALSNNKLSGVFPKGLPNLRSLQYFLMDDNPMFVPLPFQLGRLVKLQELRLANSGYTGPIPGSFGWLTNLTTLSLENNRLTGEIPRGLSELGRMYHLNLSRNLLGGVVPFGSSFITRLGRNLDLSGNPGLCVDGSQRLEGVKVGVGVCGANNASGPSAHQTSSASSSSSGAAALSLHRNFYRLLLIFWLRFPILSSSLFM
ncbi:uncharacterized protein A4U43_UnF520 [Asparagus officinalis]|uniref:Leucine-rich repeat-containing N-terminal plant-type domain-containing protein n=2 Tax=Asparagus officinalis TaxID=4686 RepID=A0A1R3L7S5_ASPOF|nr:uncharacterized protein A4U43_UnF520 [Asparagus officinalis]